MWILLRGTRRLGRCFWRRRSEVGLFRVDYCYDELDEANEHGAKDIEYRVITGISASVKPSSVFVPPSKSPNHRGGTNTAPVSTTVKVAVSPVNTTVLVQKLTLMVEALPGLTVTPPALDDWLEPVASGGMGSTMEVVMSVVLLSPAKVWVRVMREVELLADYVVVMLVPTVDGIDVLPDVLGVVAVIDEELEIVDDVAVVRVCGPLSVVVIEVSSGTV